MAILRAFKWPIKELANVPKTAAGGWFSVRYHETETDLRILIARDTPSKHRVLAYSLPPPPN